MTLLAQGVQLVRDQTGASGLDAGIQGAAAIAMVILLLFRFVGVMRRQDHSNRREHALREAGGALVSSIDREAIAAATIRAAKGLAAEHGPLEARLLDIDGRHCLLGPSRAPIACNLPEDCRPGLERGEIVSVRGSAPVAVALALPEGTPHVSMVPLFLDGVLRYGLAVALESRPSIAVGQALLALSLQAGLALEARDLADRLAARRTQAWFESLVHNASDVIVVIDAEGIIRFVSPASERVLGRQPDALLNRALTEVVIDGERPVVAAWISAIAANVAIRADMQQETRTLEFGVMHPDGRSLMVEAVSSNLLENVAVGGIVLNLRDVSERLAFEAELTRRASHDGLTGLANPALFRERLAQALRSRRDESRAVSVLFIDLDDFKSVNDSLGHGSGDRVLVAVADRLRQSVRGSETVARLGGDEFGILVQGRGQTPTKLAERVLATLATPIGLDETEVTIQASIGIATAGPNEHGSDLVAELLRSADGAMYAAKNAGKGRWSRFEPVMPNEAAPRPTRRVGPTPAAVV